MGEGLSGTNTVQREVRRIWLTVLLGVALCLGTVMVIPSTYAAVDDLGVQMVLAGAMVSHRPPKSLFYRSHSTTFCCICISGYPRCPGMAFCWF